MHLCDREFFNSNSCVTSSSIASLNVTSMLLISLTEFSLEYSSIFRANHSPITEITRLKHARKFAGVNSRSSVASKHCPSVCTVWFHISTRRIRLVFLEIT